MSILLTGRKGQVGVELERVLPALGPLVAMDRSALDMSRPEDIRRVIRDTGPRIIINTAAYTAVDKAESEPEYAIRVNAVAPGVLGEEALKIGAILIHLSTDYVFDGRKAEPYVETDEPNPLNVYGRSKLAGEKAVQASGCRYLILRTSWVYGPSGTNFLLTMLRFAGEGKSIRVVDDQRGAPTSSLMLAAAIVQVIARIDSSDLRSGVYHMTAGGETTWYGFARAIFAESGLKSELTAIASAQYPTLARRPANSILNNGNLLRDFGIVMPTWTLGLREVLTRLGHDFRRAVSAT